MIYEESFSDLAIIAVHYPERLEHGSSPLAPEARGRHSTSTSLAFKVIRIVYNPPFEKFLDPSLVLYFIVLVIVNIDGYVFLFKMDGSAVINCPEFFLM